MLRAAFTLCLCAHLATAAFSDYSGAGEDNDLTRWAQFRHGGPLQTNRRIRADTEMQPATSTRLLISTPSSSSQQHPQSLWLLGVGPTEQHQQVYSSLQAGACQLLHTLPGEHLHWMVRCDAQAVEQLLGQHTHLTVAELPATHKRGDTLDAWRISTRAFSHGLKPWPSSMKDAPQDMHKYLSQQQPGQAPTAALLALLPELPAEQREALQHSLTQHISIWVQQQAQGSAATGCEQSKVQQMGPALRVVVCMQLVSEMAELLSQQPEVTWVDLEPRMVLHDLYANAVGQAPEKFTTSYPAPSVQGGLGNAASAAFYPYWQAGLDGTGEVVGVVDSGMDMDSCYLTDPGAGDYRQNPTSLTISDAGDSVDVFSSNTHRKVAQYAFFADDHDDLEGHGTHVATAIVGAPYGADSKQSPDQATGVAPGARVAMFDVGGSYGGVEGLPYYTANDQPAYNLMYDVMSQAGAKVMSNSWGTLSNSSMASVASICYLMDNYAVSHPDMLFVFSAGNDGEYYINSDGSIRVDAGGTVRAPGSCKNMLTVGAATSFFYKGVLSYKFPLKAATGPVQLQPEGFLSFANAGDLVFKFPQAQPGETGTLTYSIVQMLPNYDSGPFPLQGIDVPVIEASPADACGPLDPTIFQPYNQPVMVVFTRSARCSMSDAANNVLSNANVKGALMWYDPTNDALINNDTFEITPATGFDGKPGVQLPKRTVDVLRQSGWSVGDNAVTVTWSPPDTTGLPPTDHVASFSSYGSLYAFQRPRRPGAVVMKPDIVAPGFTLAGASDGQYTGTMDNCMAVTMQGTSMAAPQVSGGALLARQYFKKGFYPSGAANASAGFEPSGVLLKAVLIAGTAAMQGVSTATYDNLDPPPSAFQGFGRMDLASSLPLANDQLGWTIQVLDMVPIASGDVHTYTINVAAGQGKPLIVTMVYNDPMAYPDATSSTVNDLDLAVQALGGSPNSASSGGATSSTQTFYPNGLSAPDPANNVEKIYIGTPAASRYSITVRGKYVQPSGGQTYSLVVLGAVASRLDSPYNPASAGFTPNPRLVASPSPPGGSNIKVQGAGSVAAGPRTAALAWLAGMSALLAMLMG